MTCPPPADDKFVTNTHTELARLCADAKKVRRGRPNHPWCADRAACRHCDAIRLIHARIDDHLNQLEGIDPPPGVEPLDETRTDAADCGCCGRARYMNLAGAIACLACDGWPQGRWVNMDGDLAVVEDADS